MRGRVRLEKLTVPQLVRHKSSFRTYSIYMQALAHYVCSRITSTLYFACCNSMWKLVWNCRQRVPNDVTHFMQYWLAGAGGRVEPTSHRRTCRSFGHTRLLFGQLNRFYQLFYLCCMKSLHYSTLKAYKFSGVRRWTTDLISLIGLKLQQPLVYQTKTHVSRYAIRLFLCLSFPLILLVPASLYFS